MPDSRTRIRTEYQTIKASRVALFALALPLYLSASATGKPLDAAARCSKSDLPSRQPSLFFIGSATAVTRDAAVRGAGERLEETFSGTVVSQLFEADRVAGTSAAQLPPGARHFFVVPWGYESDCTPIKWPSHVWVEPGSAGLVYGQLRAREHWVEGVPTIDTHNPYQLPYPRFPRSTTPEDAFTLLSLLPTPGDFETRGTEALLPLAEWISTRPELRRTEPGRMLHSFLMQMTYQQIRYFEPEIAGTYRFTLDLGDGESRVFYGRTESHAVTPHRVETGTAFLEEIRPPLAQGYSMIVAVAEEQDRLPAHRGAGQYGYVYVDLVPQRQSDGSRLWQAGAELTLLRHAFSADLSVQQIARLDGGDLQYFLEHNVPPASDAAFRMLPDGRVTFRQRYHLQSGKMAVLRGERTSTVVMQSPR